MDDKKDMLDIVLDELKDDLIRIEKLIGGTIHLRADRIGESFRVWRTRDAEIAYDYVIAGFVLHPMDACPWVVSSSGSYVSSTYQGKRVGSTLHNIRLRGLRKANVKVLLCTTNDKNAPQTAILLRNGWQTVSRFANSITKEAITLWKKEL